MKNLLFVSTVILVLLLSACAPSVDRTLSVYGIRPLEPAPQSVRALRGAKLRVGEFRDARVEERVGAIDGRSLSAEGDVAVSVRLAVEDALRMAGADLSMFSGPSLTGEVLEWTIAVKPGFPSTKMEARAEVRLQVLNGAGEKGYSATYSGSVETEHPLVNQSKIEQSLGEAMAYAIKAALTDSRLLAGLSPGTLG